MHDAGILHRDISPSNVMLDEKYRARLIDFGSSRAYCHEMSTELTVILKKGFAPLEQYSKKEKHGPAEDVYAICASMYYTMTGKVPPAATDRHVFDTLQPIHSYYADIPDDIEKIILKGLSIHPEDRYQDMKALSSAIDLAVAPKPEAIIKRQAFNMNSVVDLGGDGSRKSSTIDSDMAKVLGILAAVGVAFSMLITILILIL